MSGSIMCEVPVKAIYNNEYIAPKEIEHVHSILDLFNPDTKLDVYFTNIWDNSKEEYVTYLTGLEINIDYRYVYTVYSYNLTKDKI